MNLSRREFLQLMIAASVAGLWTPRNSNAASGNVHTPSLFNGSNPSEAYKVPTFGNVSFLHITDCHAQLMPVYYREPDIHIGIGNLMENELPHLVGKHLLDYLKIHPRTHSAHALTFLDFPELAVKFGKTGGFAHLSTLVKKIRAERPGSLLLDGGDTWQGSATALWTNAQDMVDASLLLGVDIMTGHWEFTYGMERLQHVLENDFAGKIEFLAQNIVDLEFEDPVFKAYSIREMNGVSVAIIGQAFPYTPIANPRRFVPNWQFGINEDRMRANIKAAKAEGAEVVVVLSHNGMDIDMKMAGRIDGIDAILGGHTHDAVPVAIDVKNPSGGKTIVINSGTSGKFLSVLDLDVRKGKIQDYRYNLLPVFSNMLEPDPVMNAHIEKVRQPYQDKLNEVLAVSDSTLYRRGTFNGTFDQIIVDALMKHQNAEIAFSPGFRWGTTVLPGQNITREDLMAQTAITYPDVRRNEVTGAALKEMLEDIADNRFSPDPYMQQGGDMVRVGGLQYSIDPTKPRNKRILSMELNGKAIDARKKYILAAWAGMEPNEKAPKIWDVVGDYLKDNKVITAKTIDLNLPKMMNIKNNKGIDHA